MLKTALRLFTPSYAFHNSEQAEEYAQDGFKNGHIDLRDTFDRVFDLLFSWSFPFIRKLIYLTDIMFQKLFNGKLTPSKEYQDDLQFFVISTVSIGLIVSVFIIIRQIIS